MNYPRLASHGFFVLTLATGGATAIAPGCASPYKNPGTQTLDGTGGSDATSPGTGIDCPAGSEGCDCYGNGSCNVDLVCASQLCVNLNGLTGGSAGGTSGNGNGGAPSVSGGNGSGTMVTGGAGVTLGGSRATGGASATGGDTFWKTVTYSATGLPNPSNGNHNQGLNCIQCHVSGSSSGAPVWLFGGTVYKANGTTPAPNVQVGINDGTNLYTTYSATNGNIWLPASGTINWTNAQVRIRNSNGELTMAGATPASTCNLCHNSTSYPRITAP
jgi:hypothetical protein